VKKMIVFVAWLALGGLAAGCRSDLDELKLTSTQDLRAQQKAAETSSAAAKPV
jgi:hypothetical protein